MNKKRTAKTAIGIAEPATSNIVREVAQHFASMAFDPDRLCNEHEAADFLGLSVRTMQMWRIRKGGPAFCKLGSAVRYRRADLVAFIEARLQGE